MPTTDTEDSIVERILDQFDASDADCTEAEKIERHRKFMMAADAIAARHEKRTKQPETPQSRAAARAR